MRSGVPIHIGHFSSVQCVPSVTLAYKNVIKKMAVSGAWVCPGGLKLVFLVEQSVGDDKRIFRAKIPRVGAHCHCSCQYHVFL